LRFRTAALYLLPTTAGDLLTALRLPDPFTALSLARDTLSPGFTDAQPVTIILTATKLLRSPTPLTARILLTAVGIFTLPTVELLGGNTDKLKPAGLGHGDTLRRLCWISGGSLLPLTDLMLLNLTARILEAALWI